MANISKAERERRAQEAEQAAPITDGTVLVKVSKNGECLFVHPTALTQHKQLGWQESNS